MCDYCDCRSHLEITALSADHEALLSVTAAMGESLAAGHPVSGHHVDELRGLLVPHAQREEVGLFAAMRDAGVDPHYVGWFEDDHQRIEGLLATAAHDCSAARLLIELVEDHILREETDMFPAARQLLDPDQWDAVDGRVLQLR